MHSEAQAPVNLEQRGRKLMSAPSEDLMPHLDFWQVAAKQCQSPLVDWPGLPGIQLPGLHEREVYQEAGIKRGSGGAEIDRAWVLFVSTEQRATLTRETGC